jgi:WbqC-like protein family
MTRAAIMQPAYLPWIGYFDLMDQVDEFVLLDSVAFSHQSWQHRNRIRTAEGLLMLTIPVATSGRQGQLISEVEIDRRHRFETKHIGSIQGAYSRAPYGSQYIEAVAELIRVGASGGRLVDLTVPIIELMANQLGVTTPIRSSSGLGVSGERSDRLVEICNAVGADTYLSPRGAAEYLDVDAAVFVAAGIEVGIQEYEHPTYSQLHEPFISHASSLDLLCNVGPESLAVLRQGRRPAVALEAVGQ